MIPIIDESNFRCDKFLIYEIIDGSINHWGDSPLMNGRLFVYHTHLFL